MRDPEVTVGDLSVADAPKAAQLERESFSDFWSEKTVYETISGADGRTRFALGAWRGQCLAGYLFGTLAADEAELHRLAVSVRYRRSGVALQLIREFSERLERRGCKELFLELREDNTAAACLYEKAGFLKIGRRKGYYHDPDEDAVIMKKIY